jgi:ABC-type multidrug transport system ATPase subunit
MPFVESTSGAVASLRGATVILGERAVLRDVDLDVVPGITVLRGPNGSGKTTALRALAGLVPLSRGSRAVPGDLLYLGHRAQLLHGLTAREDLRFLHAFRGLTSRARAYAVHPDGTAADADVVGMALRRWGLADDADRPVERLSAGQRRRAALARLDTETCAVALLDEPFAELDAAASDLLRESLADLARALGVAILVASHAHGALDRIASREYELRDGRVRAA